MAAPDSPSLLVSLGHGYSAMHLSRLLAADGGWTVIGTTRSRARCRDVSESGAECLIWPGEPIEDAIESATHLLVSAAPTADGDPVLGVLDDCLARAARGLKWVGYLSTTAVYGDCGGRWVDEDAPLAPTTERGRARAAAERAWQALANRSGLPLHVFRLAGIYGPGRGPLAQLQSGRKTTQIVREGQVFNRIHVADIARLLHRSMLSPMPGRVYNVCDDRPEAPETVADHAADLLGLPRPRRIGLEEATVGPMARSFYSESKRVRNDRIKEDLGVRLRFPDYASGLKSLAKGEG